MARDVELVIKAKDAATTAIESIKDALKELIGVQEDVGRSASKTDTLLSDLGRQLAQLNREAQNLSSLGKIASELDKAGGAVARIEKSLHDSARGLEDLSRETKDAEQTTRGLKTQSEQLTRDLKAQAAATKEAKAAQTAANAELRAAERTLASLQKRLTSATKPSEDLVKQVQAQSQLVASLRQNQQQAVATYQAQKQAQEGAAASLRGLNEQLKVAERNQSSLVTQTEKAGKSVERQKEELTKARSALGEIEKASAQAGAALGGMAVSQDKVSAASARMASEIGRTQARIEALSKSPTRATAAVVPTLDQAALTQQRRAMLESRKEWANTEAEVKRLAAALKGAATPTREMGEALGKAQAQARLAKQEYIAQRNALHAMGSAAQSTFLTFSRGVSQMQSGVRAGTTATRGLASASTAAAAAIQPIAPAATAAGAALQNASGGANGLRGALSSLYGESRKSLSLMQRLRGEVLSLTAGYFGLQSALSNIGNVIGAFQTLEAAQSRLGAVFNQDTGLIRKELSFLERQAQRLGISFEVLSNQYSKFAIAADAANFSASATRDIFLSVAEAGRVNKLSVDQLNGIFLALEQMISKGKISAEELRRQLGDRLPGAFNIMAKALGVTTAELDEMMRKGELVADQSNLLKFAAELNKRFGSQLPASLRSTTAEIGRWADNMYQAQLRVAEGGFIEGFTEALRELNQWFQSRDGRDFFLAIGAALGRFAQGLAKLPQYFTEIQFAISAFIGFKLAGIFTDIVGAIRQTQGSLTNASRTFFSWNGTVQAARAQVVALRAGVAPLTGALFGLRAQLLGVSTAAGIAGARFVMMQASMATLRAVAVGVVGAFRLIWTAFGGLPGLVLTGITFAAGAWLTSVDDATSALDEHKRIMGEVVSAYERVKGATKDWAKEIKNVSLDQANANLRQMAGEWEKARDAVNGVRRSDFFTVSALSPDQRNLARNILDVVEAFGEGKKTASEFVDSVEELYRSITDDSLRAWTESLLATGRGAEEAQQRYGEAALTAQELGSTVDGLDYIVKRLGISIGKMAEAAADGSEDLGKAEVAAQKFKEAIDGIADMVPALATELKKLGEIDALNKLYRDAVNVARTMGEVQRATELYGQALNGINAKAIDGAVSGGLVDKIIGVESGGNANAKNPNSSATGLGQFISSTWLRMFKQYFPDRAAGLTDAMILEYRKNATISRQMVELYVKENAAVLQKAGIALIDANLYLAHFLGPGGAKALLSAPRGTRTEDVLGPAAINANPGILRGKTVDDVSAWAQRKVGISSQELSIQKEIAETDAKRAEKAKGFNTDLENRLSLQEAENSNAGQLTQEAFVQKRLAEEQKKAREADYTLTAEQIERIKQVAAAEWQVAEAKRDGSSATKEANIALQQAVALGSQRAALQRQFNEAVRSGDTTTATALQTQIDRVNLQLEEAIAKARAMWEAIGGPQADVALTKLDTLKVKTNTAANSMSLFGLSTQQWGNIASSFADGLLGVFDQFAQAVANGEDATRALGRAFLQFAANFLREIAQMILKQLIMNALQSFGFPGIGIGVGHTGGRVGAAGIGSGNARRSVSPAIFASAVVLHGGGIPALRPGEVPAILKEEEEVLTRDDPRHRMNGGMNPRSAPQETTIRNVVTLDPEFADSMIRSAVGEQAILSVVRKNIPTLKQFLK